MNNYDQCRAAFEHKMLLSLQATGGDFDKVAADYEEELEKIAFLGGAVRAGRTLLGLSPSPAAAKRLAAMRGPSVASQRLSMTTGARPLGSPGAGELTGAAREKAMKEFRGLPSPRTPKAQAATKYKGTPQEVAAQRLQAATAGTPPASTGTPQTATPAQASPGVSGLAQQHFGLDVDKMRSGMGQWFGSLTPQQRQNILMGAGGVGVAGLGYGAGAALG